MIYDNPRQGCTFYLFGGMALIEQPKEGPVLEASTPEETLEPVRYPIFEIPARDIIADVPFKHCPLSAKVIDAWFSNLPTCMDAPPDEQGKPSGTSKG